MLVVVAGWHGHTNRVCSEALPLLVPIHGCQAVSWATPAHHHAATAQSLLGSAHDYLLLLGHRCGLQGTATGVQDCTGRPSPAEGWQAPPVPPGTQFAVFLRLRERNISGWCTRVPPAVHPRVPACLKTGLCALHSIHAATFTIKLRRSEQST